MKKICQSAEEATEVIHAECGGGKGWIVGITSNPRRRLAAVHTVNLTKADYFWVECADEAIARNTEFLLYEKLGYGTVRNPPTMAVNMVYVYAYRVTDDTSEAI